MDENNKIRAFVHITCADINEKYNTYIVDKADVYDGIYLLDRLLLPLHRAKFDGEIL